MWMMSSAAAAAATGGLRHTSTRPILRKASSLPISVVSDVEMIASNDRSSSSSVCCERRPSESSNNTATTTTTRCLSRSSSSSISTQTTITTTTTHEILSSASIHSSLSTQVRCYSSTSLLQQSSQPLAVAGETTTTTTANSSSSMKDEYGAMDDGGDTFRVERFQLESGSVLDVAELRYQTYGTLDPINRDNVLVVCHALTGNASLHAWWGDLLGEGRPFDTSRYFIVCCNILGSCYGSTGPRSLRQSSSSSKPYGMDFPDVSVRDSVRLQIMLLQQQLGIRSVKCVIGGSFGGMQTLEFAVQAGIRGDDAANDNDDPTDDSAEPFVRSVIPIACNAQHSAWQIGISEVQRQAIQKDPMWKIDPFKATNGLEIARQIGMISYRTRSGYQAKFGRRQSDKDAQQQLKQETYGSLAAWQVKQYLEYQGRKFLTRFDPVTYVKLTEQMDSHNVFRNRPRDILQQVQIPALVMGISSDVLYPLTEQIELAEQLGNAQLKIIESEDGHDGFLLEQEQVGNHIVDFLDAHE